MISRQQPLCERELYGPTTNVVVHDPCSCSKAYSTVNAVFRETPMTGNVSNGKPVQASVRCETTVVSGIPNLRYYLNNLLVANYKPAVAFHYTMAIAVYPNYTMFMSNTCVLKIPTTYRVTEIRLIPVPNMSFMSVCADGKNFIPGTLIFPIKDAATVALTKIFAGVVYTIEFA